MRPSPPPPPPPLPPPLCRRRLHCCWLVVVLFGFVDISPAPMAIGARKVEPPPGPYIQYEPDVVDLALPRAVVQQPRRVSQERLIVQRGAPKGGVGASGRGQGGRVVAWTPRWRRRQRPSTLTSAPSSRLKFNKVINMVSFCSPPGAANSTILAS
jgi:hypothetical protein